MTIRKIITINDETDISAILHKPADSVTNFDDNLQNLIYDLIDTMKSDIICICLAAPQIGVSQQVAVVCLDRNFSNAKIIINPTNVIESGHKDIKRESCMSLPDLCGNIERRKHLSVNINTVNGDKTTLQLADFEARAVIHEIDHLNGILYSDKIKGELSPISFDEVREKLKHRNLSS